MKREYSRRVRLHQICFMMSFVSVLAFVFIGTSHQLHAITPDPPLPIPENDYKINGREYIDNGIVFDIPKVGDPSREATVVSFPNRAVIPGYISVDGVKYTVRKIYMAANTWLGDTASWVTLPPTLTDCKNFTRRYYWGSSKSGKRYKILGVTNINVTDLNSFFNSDFTDQTPYNVYDDIRFLDHSYKPQYPMWRLYLNGEPVIDIVYPEGSKMGVSLLGLSYINSITIPASDTCRNKTFGEQWQLLKFPLALDEWMKWGRNPKKLKFAANSGYDLRYYDLPVDSIELPRKMTVFEGYANFAQFPLPLMYPVISRWPENLQVITTTRGIKNFPPLEDLPKTLIKIGGHATCKLNSNGYAAVIPSNIKELDTCTITNVNSNYIIAEGEEPLSFAVPLSLGKVKNLEIYRKLQVKGDATRMFSIGAVDTIVLGPQITTVPEEMLRISATPKFLRCLGTTPPDFKVKYPEILDWKDITWLVIPEEAMEAYMHHPIWKQFTHVLALNTSSITADREIKAVRWYSLDGQVLAEPERGKINIRVITYTDGTQSRQKIAVPQ